MIKKWLQNECKCQTENETTVDHIWNDFLIVIKKDTFF